MADISSYTVSVIYSLQTLCTCIISVWGQYIYAYYLDIYPEASNSTKNFTETTPVYTFQFLKKFHEETKKCLKIDISSQDSDAQAWAQEKSAELYFWTNLYSTCPLIIMTYILCLYTPKLGKRFVLLLNIIGGLAQFAIWLAVIYFQLPNYWWYISAVILGISGSSGVLSFVLTLVIVDDTNNIDLSVYFVQLGAIQTAVSAIGTFAIGYYIEWRGYTNLCWMGLGFEVISILIAIFMFKSSNTTPNERTPLLVSNNTTDEFKELPRTLSLPPSPPPPPPSSSSTCGLCLQVCTVFHCNEQRSSKKTASLLLTLFSNIFYTLATATFAPFLWFLLNAPFCWTSKDIGNYSALASISSSILSVLGMQAMTNIGASDAVICLISHAFFLTSSVWSAFARHDWELYAGLIVSAFSGYQGSLTMSMMSKWLEPHERSNAFTLVTEINTIMTAFGTTLFTWVYARTVVSCRNLTLLLGAGLCVVPMILNLCLAIITRKMPEEDLPPLSETDIEPAPLRLPHSGPPHAGDAACIVIPSRSLTSSMRTPNLDRSRVNSIVDSSEPEETLDASTDNLIVL